MNDFLETWRRDCSAEVNGYDWVAAGCPAVDPTTLLVFDGDLECTPDVWSKIVNAGCRGCITGTIRVSPAPRVIDLGGGKDLAGKWMPDAENGSYLTYEQWHRANVHVNLHQQRKEK